MRGFVDCLVLLALAGPAVAAEERLRPKEVPVSLSVGPVGPIHKMEIVRPRVRRFEMHLRYRAPDEAAPVCLLSLPDCLEAYWEVGEVEPST